MKKLSLAAAVLSVLVLAGCSTTKVFEIDPATGKVVKYTETDTDIAGTIAQSTKDKSLFVWHGGWAGYISVSPGTQDDPSPHGKAFVGKRDGGYFSLHEKHQTINFSGLAECIRATNSDLSIGADITKGKLEAQENKADESK